MIPRLTAFLPEKNPLSKMSGSMFRPFDRPENNDVITGITIDLYVRRVYKDPCDASN